MDDTDLLKISGLSASTIAILLIVYRVIKMMVGKKLISSCCGRKIEMGVDIAQMTPKPPEETHIEIHNPIQKKSEHTVEPDVRQSNG